MSLSELKAGAAKRCISPTLDMLPLPNMKGSFTDIREGEDLTVRALVLDNGERNLLMVSWELAHVPCPDIIRANLSKKFGFNDTDMFLFATHNHQSPFFTSHRSPPKRSDNHEGPSDGVQRNTARFTELIIERTAEAVGEAIEKLRPAKFGYGEGKSYINVNRDQYYFEGYWMQGTNFEGCSDKTLAVLKFVDEDGNLIAALLNYAVHSNAAFCENDIDGKMKVTCDFPGIACNFIEKYYKKHFGCDAIVLWQAGAAGNQNPYFMAGKHVYDLDGNMRVRDRVPGAAYEQAEVFGQEHAIDALKILRNIDASKSKVNITTVDDTLYFPTQTFPEGVDRSAHRIMVDNIQEWAGVISPEDPMPEKHLVDMIPSDEKVPMKAQLVIIGDVAIFGVACEPYNEIGLLCKKASPLKKTIIATHIGEPSVGYVLDNASKNHKVFQSFGTVRPGQSNEIMVNGMLNMFDKAL